MSISHTSDSAAISARLDRIPVATTSHWTILFLLSALGLFDAFDLLIFGYTAPAIRANLGLPIEAVGYIASGAFFGSFIGALAGGLLADRFGRRPVLIVGVVIYSLGSGIAAFANNLEMLVAARMVTGLGAQAVIIVSMIYIVEMFPATMRGRFVALYMGIVAPAAVLAAVSSLIIVPMGPEHWRIVYAIGACGVVVAILAWRSLPESIRWQAQKGHTAAAIMTLSAMEIEAAAKTGRPLPEPVAPSGAPALRPSMREMLDRETLGRVLVLILAMALFAYVFYGFNTWLTTLLVERGYTQRQALTAAVVITIANSLGSFAFAPFADRVERKTLILMTGVTLAGLMLVFGLVSSLVVTIVTGFLLSGILQITSTTLAIYAAEIFPIHLRGLGAGIGGAAARLSATSGSIIIGLVLATFGFSAVFIVFASAAVTLGIGFFLLGERTKGRRLEDITANQGTPLAASFVTAAPAGHGARET